MSKATAPTTRSATRYSRYRPAIGLRRARVSAGICARSVRIAFWSAVAQGHERSAGRCSASSIKATAACRVPPPKSKIR